MNLILYILKLDSSASNILKKLTKSLKRNYLAIQKLLVTVCGVCPFALRGHIPAERKHFLSQYLGLVREQNNQYFTHVFTNVLLLPGQRTEVELQVSLQVSGGRFVALQAWSWVLKHVMR